MICLSRVSSLLLDRELPPLAKNYVMRMLFLDQPLPQAAVALWVKKDSQKYATNHIRLPMQYASIVPRLAV